MTRSARLPPQDVEHVLTHTEALWEQLRSQTVLITGGSGFIGRWLCETFLAANKRHALGSRLLVLTRQPSRFARDAPHLAADPAFVLVEGNAQSFDLPSNDCSTFIHAATEDYDACGRADAFPLLAEVSATAHVIELATMCSAGRLLFTSSGAVYGRIPPDVTHVPEDYHGAADPLDADNGYAQAKRASESLCAMATRFGNLETMIARCFSFVGPHLPLDRNYAVGNFIRDALDGGPIRILGDGSPLRSYLYAADMAIWLWTILLRGRPGVAYNVGSEEPVSIAQLAREVADIIAPGMRVETARSPAPGRPVTRQVPSTESGREHLGLRSWISRGEALRRTIAWLSSG